jgi:hypothetical protein
LFEEPGDVELEGEAVGMRGFPLIIADRVFLLAQLEGGQELFERFEEGFGLTEVHFLDLMGELDGVALHLLGLLFAWVGFSLNLHTADAHAGVEDSDWEVEFVELRVYFLDPAGILHEYQREVDGLAILRIDVQSNVSQVVEDESVFVSVVFFDIVCLRADEEVDQLIFVHGSFGPDYLLADFEDWFGDCFVLFPLEELVYFVVDIGYDGEEFLGAEFGALGCHCVQVQLRLLFGMTGEVYKFE